MAPGRKLLLTSPPRLMSVVSLCAVCSLAQVEGGSVLFLSVDRPKSYMSSIVERFCPDRSRVRYQDYTTLQRGEISCIAGLFAPKLLLETLDHLAKAEGRPVSVAVSNLSALTYYNSNDRVREFMNMLERKVAEGRIRRLVLLMEAGEQYLYNEVKEFVDELIRIGG